MGEIARGEHVKDFNIETSLLPERFTVTAARKVGDKDYIVIGMENGKTYCSWLYNPDCGFIYGHYQLTQAEAFRDLLRRG